MVSWRQLAPLAAWSLFLVLFVEFRVNTEVQGLREQNRALVEQISLADPALRYDAPVHAAVENAVADSAFLQTPPSEPRRLNSIYTIGTAATSGCYDVTAAATLDLSSATCSGSAKCPACFFASALSADVALVLQSCSTAVVTTSGTTSYSGIREYVIINGDTADTLTVTDGHASPNSFLLGPGNMVVATCYSGGSDRLYFQSNYGVAGVNVATCPDACDAAAPLMASDPTTAFSTTQNLVVATAALAETWGTESGSGGYCPRGCDVAAPNYGSGNAFTVSQNLLVATAALAETWGTESGSGGYCPRGCDVAAPNYGSGNAFTVSQNLLVATAALAETWGTDGGYCPRGCDAATPNYGSGNAFSTVKHIITANTDYLTSNSPTANIVWATANTECTSGEQVCMSR